MTTPRPFRASWPQALALGLLLAYGSADGLRPASAAEQVALKTIYLTHPIGDVHRISIKGNLGGSGQMLLDTNRCGLNLFGDTTICTNHPMRPTRIDLVLLQVKDIKGEGRRVYRLQGAVHPPEYRYYLTVPKEPGGNYRLAVMNAKGRVRVLSLEESAVRRMAPPAERPGRRELGEGTFTATQAKGKVMLRARGTHPTAGYGTALERLPAPVVPPEFRLVRYAPTVEGAPAATPFDISTTFDAPKLVRFVNVYDATGRRRVPVSQGERPR